MDAATYASAAEAAVAIARDLPAALARDQRRMLPFFLLVGDARSAFVLRYRDDGVVDVTPVAENTVHVLSVRGLDSPDAALTDVLRRGSSAGRDRPPERRAGTRGSKRSRSSHGCRTWTIGTRRGGRIA